LRAADDAVDPVFCLLLPTTLPTPLGVSVFGAAAMTSGTVLPLTTTVRRWV